jgi:hypothetical protein
MSRFLDLDSESASTLAASKMSPLDRRTAFSAATAVGSAVRHSSSKFSTCLVREATPSEVLPC